MKTYGLPSAASDIDNENGVEQFVIEVPTIMPKVLGQDVKKMFEDDTSLEGITVMEGGCPAGLIMRTAFFQKISTMHGHSLFMKRPIDLVMDTGMMTISTQESIAQIGIRAMNREQSKLYDYIIVNKDNRYIGVISIRLFLVDLANRNSAQIEVLKEQQRELIAANEKEMMLSRDIEQKSNSIRNLLDNADQGFLFFEQDMMVKNEYSYKCNEIFSAGIGGKNFITLIRPYFNEERINVFREVLQSYFENNSAVTDNVFLMLLPSECIVGKKHIHIAYRRIESNSEKAVMAILNDVTEKFKMEQALERDRIRQRLIIKAISCQSQIKQMIDEFTQLFAAGYNSFFEDAHSLRDSLNELFRAVHTFKGDFAQYGFTQASEHLHTFEDRLGELVRRDGEVSLDEIEAVMHGIDTNEVLKDDLAIIEEALGESYFGGREVVSVPRHKLEEAIDMIRSEGSSIGVDKALDIVRGLKRKPIKDYLEQYRDYVQYLADKLLKTMPVYIVEGDEIEVYPEEYNGFIKSLVHIYRNIMDHGIERDEERLEAGKPQRGVIRCETERKENTFSLTISDDGNGIDTDKLRSAALEKGGFTQEEICAMSEADAANLIFCDSVSTKRSTTSISGRGVGMAAFREAAEKIGGSIALSTTRGKGTEFTVEFPI